MTIEEVIAYLEQCRDDFGGHAEVVVNADDIVDDQMDFIALDQIPDWIDTYGGFRKSRRGTATTRHIAEMTVSVPGDDGVDTELLHKAIVTGLEYYGIEVLGVQVSPDMMARDLAMVLNDEETYTSLRLCTIREFDETGEFGEIIYAF